MIIEQHAHHQFVNVDHGTTQLGHSTVNHHAHRNGNDNRNSAHSHDAFSSGYTQRANAVPLIADRVSLPKLAGQINLLDPGVLPPSIAAQYADPTRVLRQFCEPAAASNTANLSGSPDKPRSARAARVFASHTEYVKLINRMIQSRMIEFTTSPVVINGLFGVMKPDGAIRLIVDGRPSCEAFIDSPRVTLPTPDLLARLQFTESQLNSASGPPPIWVAKCDLSDFFFRFRIPRWMLPYFALPPVNTGDLSDSIQAEFGGNTLVYPCLAVLAMGWSHSVYLTQSAHEHFLNNKTGLQPADRITPTSDLMLDRLRHLVYVDDVIIIGTQRSQVNSAQCEYITESDRANMPTKPSKIIRPSTDGVDCLGLELNGREHTVAPRADKLWRLRMDTAWLVRRGECTGRELAAIVGRWTWFMLVARPALACFSAVYRFIECADRTRFTLWASVERELWLVARLSPLFISDIAAGWCTQAIATDASLQGQGIVAARVEPELIVTVAAQPPFPAINSITNGESALSNADALAAAIADDADLSSLIDRRWTTIVSAPWLSVEHINSLEMRAVSTAIRWNLSHPTSIRRRLLLLSDSTAVVGSLTKGRTSSFTLLSRLRPVAALLLASGVQLRCRWIPSSINPADGPSRAWQPQQPQQPQQQQ